MGAESANQQIRDLPLNAPEAAIAGRHNSLDPSLIENIFAAAATDKLAVGEEDPQADKSNVLDTSESVVEHSHSERAKNMTFQEAIAPGGCGGLRAVAQAQGEEAAQKLYNMSMPAIQQGGRVKLAMPPPKGKPKSTPEKPVKAEAVDTSNEEQAAAAATRPNTNRAATPAVAEIVLQPMYEMASPPSHEGGLSSAPADLSRRAESAISVVTLASSQESRQSILVAASLQEVDEAVLTDGREIDLKKPTTDDINEKAQVETALSALVAELEPPEVLLERFTTALLLLVGEAPIRAQDGSLELSADYSNLEPEVLDVVVEVAGKLAEITAEQQMAVIAIVQDISESMQTIRQLQSELATPSEVDAVTQEIREHVIRLFDTIGLEYDDQKIQLFMRALLSPAFAAHLQVSLTPEQLAGMGTHEAKLDRIIARVMSLTAQDGIIIAQKLGQAVLFFVRLSRVIELRSETMPT